MMHKVSTIMNEIKENIKYDEYANGRISRKFRDCKYELMELQKKIHPCFCDNNDEPEEVKEKMQVMLKCGIKCAIETIEKYIEEAEAEKESCTARLKKLENNKKGRAENEYNKN